MHNCQDLELSKISFKSRMNKQPVVYPYDEILFSDKKKWAIKPWTDKEETAVHWFVIILNLHIYGLSEVVLIYLFMAQVKMFWSKSEFVYFGRPCQDDAIKIVLIIMNMWRSDNHVIDI